jgi:hypothetical protein
VPSLASKCVVLFGWSIASKLLPALWSVGIWTRGGRKKNNDKRTDICASSPNKVRTYAPPLLFLSAYLGVFSPREERPPSR